jgi:hypothetical protein
MAEIVLFPKPFKARPEPRPKPREQRAERYAKWAKWKDEVRHYGGGHRRPDRKFNSAALADIAVDKHKWREPAYRTAMATTILELLFKNRLIGIGSGTPRLYWYSAGEWKHLSDRWVTRMLAKYFNFIRDGEALQPPRWLPEALRFTAYDFLDAVDEPR